MTTPSVADILRLANGVKADELDRVVAIFAQLDARLRSFEDGSVELQLSVKDRGQPGQRTTLEAWIAGRPRLVSTSDIPEFEAALAEVRDDLIRLITDAKNRTEPRNNRALRDSS